MSDAVEWPERLNLSDADKDEVVRHLHCPEGADVGYIRTDISNARIEALEAENARMKEALEEFVDAATVCDWDEGFLSRARAALGDDT